MAEDLQAMAIARWLAGTDTPADLDILDAMDRSEFARQVQVATALHGLRSSPDAAERVRAALTQGGTTRRMRIVRTVRRRIDRRHRWPVWAAAAALIVAGTAAVLAWFASAPAPQAERLATVDPQPPAPTADASGPLRLADGTAVPAGAVVAVRPGDAFTAGPGATVRLADGSILTVEREARLRWDATWRSEDGRVRWSIAPHSLEAPFRCHAGPLGIEVLGTRFVTDAGSAWSHVLVEHGRIHAQAGGTTAVLDPGSSAISLAGTLRPLRPQTTVPIGTPDMAWRTADGVPADAIGRAAGPDGGTATSLRYDNASTPVVNWLTCFYPSPRDWSRSAAIRVVLRGHGSGHALHLELITDRTGARPAPALRSIWSLTDDSAGWRTVEIPLAGFLPRPGIPEAGSATERPDFTTVYGLGLLMTEGRGSIAIAEVQLLGP